MIALRSVHHRYGATHALTVPELHVGQGGRALVLGPSGSGKTTLLHVLAGLLRPTEGHVEVAGQDLLALSEAARDRFRGRHIGIVFQRLHLVGALTVAQNVRLARTLAGLPPDETRLRQTLAALELEDRANAFPHQLSAGQQQRVAIARAVANAPRVLLADEPTASLDDARAEAVLALLVAQAEATGATLLVATHDRRIMGAFPLRFDLAPVAP
ncbi:MAG: ABC transporter ATP-binding protein [Rubricoccaceae bacterium]